MLSRPMAQGDIVTSPEARGYNLNSKARHHSDGGGGVIGLNCPFFCRNCGLGHRVVQLFCPLVCVHTSMLNDHVRFLLDLPRTNGHSFKQYAMHTSPFGNNACYMVMTLENPETKVLLSSSERGFPATAALINIAIFFWGP